MSEEKENNLQCSSSELESSFIERMNLCAELAGSVSALARQSGISQGGIRRYFTGGEPTRPQLIAIANAVGVSLFWLATGEGPMTGTETPVVNSVSSIDEEYAFIPGYHIQVSAGTGLAVEDESVTRRLAFRRRWLKYRGLSEKDLIVVFAKGDSMEPTISDNNTIMVDRSDTSPQDGRMYVIRVDGHLLVKRTQIIPGQGVKLISDNKDYDPMLVKFDGTNPDLEVIGRVVWIGKDA